MNTSMTTSLFVVLVNEGASNFFKASHWLRQGDPLSPLFFIVVMEALNKLLMRAKELE